MATDLVPGLECEYADGVARVFLNRPEKLNALTEEMMDALPTLLERLAEDRAIKVVVLSGRGAAFSAGGDLSTVADVEARSETELLQAFRWRHRASLLLHEMPKPTVAELRGVAAGAGLALALACDLRFAAADVRLVSAFAKVGLPGDFGGTWSLQRLIGPSRARTLYFTGGQLVAAEAERIGLLDRVVPVEELSVEVGRFVDSVRRVPEPTLRAMKQNLNRALTSDFATLLDSEADSTARCLKNPETHDAIRSFFSRK